MPQSNTPNPFAKATKTSAKLRLALIGASGNGKTFSALSIAEPFGRIALIDTEHGSASKYGDVFSFDVMELHTYHPNHYIAAIKAAGSAGYDLLIIDSLSHAWNGTGGVLELVDNAAAKARDNKFAGWREGTPIHNDLVQAILSAPMHIIVTMRSKTEYVQEKDAAGKTVIRKVGLAPIQRDGIEYEFDLVGDMDSSNDMIVTKSRIRTLSNKVIRQPGNELGEQLKAWLQDGVEAPQNAPQAQPQPQVTQSEPTPTSESARGTSADALTAGLGAEVKLLDKLPRTEDGLPILGSINMGELLRHSYEAEYVTGKQHFANLIDVLWREGTITHITSPGDMFEAIRAHSRCQAGASLMTQHDPLYERDAQERKQELAERWNDAFRELCNTPSSHDYDQHRLRCIERLNAIEADEAALKEVLAEKAVLP